MFNTTASFRNTTSRSTSPSTLRRQLTAREGELAALRTQFDRFSKETAHQISTLKEQLRQKCEHADRLEKQIEQINNQGGTKIEFF